jgi:LysM repeat protein
MENNEGNIKPQQTGGLKLMTVFVAVLALHVVGIGGVILYYTLKPVLNDGDVVLDKNHKDAKILSDGSMAGDLPAGDTTSAADKTAPAPGSPADTATPPPALLASSAIETPAAPASAPAASSESTAANPTAQTPSGPIHHGPVISPPESSASPDASSMAASPTEAVPATEGTPYTVKKGDSLAKIARQHHVALAKLKAANSLTSDLLHIGQKMVIPDRVIAERTTAVAAAAPTSSSAVPTALASTPETDTILAPAEVAPPAAPAPHASHAMAKTAGGHHLYTVVKGDTLIKIARRFKTTPTAIMTANNMTDAARLSIGRKLKIPSGESRSAAASAPTVTPSEQPETKPGPQGQLANFVQ